MLNHFPGRQADEKIIMIIRKHPVVYFRLSLTFVVVALVPLAFFLRFWTAIFPVSNSGAIGMAGYLGAILVLLYSLMFLMIAILDEQFDLFVLTNHRLIDITQVSFLKRTVATTPLNQIQDTTSNIQGLLGTLLNYGSIDVKTAAGIASTFNMDHVADPGMVARVILNQAEERKEMDAKIGFGVSKPVSADSLD
jgi:hypothetical protein